MSCEALPEPEREMSKGLWAGKNYPIPPGLKEESTGYKMVPPEREPSESGFDIISAHEAFNICDAANDFTLHELSFALGAQWQFERLALNKMAESDSAKPADLVGCFSADEWADEFALVFPNGPDKETMVGWFANAIMAGHDRNQSRIAALEAELAALKGTK